MYKKDLISRIFSWWVSYDYKSLEHCPDYNGPIVLDYYGRFHPKHSDGTVRTLEHTNSPREVTLLLSADFDKKTDHRLLYRRLGVCACEVMDSNGMYQLSFFTDHEKEDKERRLHAAMLEARTRYGNNAIIKGINLLKGATTIERNTQIGGHKA